LSNFKCSSYGCLKNMLCGIGRWKPVYEKNFRSERVFREGKGIARNVGSVFLDEIKLKVFDSDLIDIKEFAIKEIWRALSQLYSRSSRSFFLCFRVNGHPGSSRHDEVLAERCPSQGRSTSHLSRMWVLFALLFFRSVSFAYILQSINYAYL